MIRQNTMIRFVLAVLSMVICLAYSRFMVRSLGLREKHVFSGYPCVIRSGSELTVFVTPKRFGFRGLEFPTAVEAISPDITLDILTVPYGERIRSARCISDNGRLIWHFESLYEGLGNPLQLRFTASSTGERIFLSCMRDHSGESNRERPIGFLHYDYDRSDIRSVTRWFDTRINPFLPVQFPPITGVFLFCIPPFVAGCLTWCVTGEYFR